MRIVSVCCTKDHTRYRRCYPGELLEDAARAGQILARGHTITVSHENLPRHFTCDPDLVRLTLRVLVDNALKSTEPGTRVQLCGGSDARGVWLEVADHGRGLVPGEEERFFEPHFRGPRQAGTGLGLSLARRITELQGGTLTGNARPDHGCVFRLWLPMRSVRASDRPRSAAVAR